MEEEEAQEEEIDVQRTGKEPMGSSFTTRKWGLFIICVLNYMLVHFHRYSPTVLASKMSEDLNVPVSQLGIFSSMYFWSYAVLQPIIGCLSDIVDSSLILGISGVLSALGSLVCGLSKSFALSSTARFLVGVGCACPYCAITRFMSNWFEPSKFSLLTSALFCFGGIGGVLSQRPLVALGNAIGWRYAQIMIACIGAVFSILAFIFVRSSPVQLGFSIVPGTMEPSARKSFVESMKVVGKNLVAVIVIPSFWIHAVSVFFATSAYQNVAGMWAVPFLNDIYNYDDEKAGTVSLSLQFVMIVGAPLLGTISYRTGLKRWLEVICYSIGLIISGTFLIFTSDIPEACLYILFFLLGVTTNSTQSFTMPMFKEMVPAELTASISGCGNCFAFLGAALMQLITSAILSLYGRQPYSAKAYKIGLWDLCAGGCAIAIIAALFLKEKKPSEGKDGSREEEEDMEAVMSEL